MTVLVNGYHNNSIFIWVAEPSQEVFLRSLDESHFKCDEKTSVRFIKPPRGRSMSQIDLSWVTVIKNKKRRTRKVKEPRYTLKPIHDGTFSFGGNEIIKSITLLELTFVTRGFTSPTIIFYSPDVCHTLEHDIKEFSIRSGKLVQAKFLFRLDIGGRIREIVFEIIPPRVKSLRRKPYSHIVGSYLEENGVKLK